MADPSDGFTNLSAIRGPKAGSLGAVSIQGGAARSSISFRVIDGASGVETDAAGSGTLPAAHINKCMLLLLLICVAIASAVLGAVGYLSEAQRPGGERAVPAHLGIQE
jgi:hypothetical protein